MAGSLHFGVANRHGVVFSLSLLYRHVCWVGMMLLVACAVLPMLVGILDPTYCILALLLIVLCRQGS